MRKNYFLFMLAVFLCGCNPILPIEKIGVEDVKRYALQIEELPQGFVLVTEEPLNTNEAVAEGFDDPVAMKKNLDKWGRSGGFLQRFASPGFDKIFLGTFGYEISIVVYTNGDGALSYLKAWRERKSNEFAAGNLLQFSAVSSPVIGDYSEVYFTSEKQKSTDGKEMKQPMTKFIIAFQRGNLLVFVDAISSNGMGSFDDALKIAQIVEEKLK